MAKGYIVAFISVKDAEAYKPYVEATTKIVEAYGGRYLVRGGEKTVLEGDAPFDRVVVIEFDSVDTAQAFYDDANYVETRKIRQANSVGLSMKVVGVEQS